jgi:hypothetical protein
MREYKVLERKATGISFSCGSTAQFWALAAFMKQDLGQSAGLLGRVIGSSQGLC